ncbi:MAG: exo-alpha-sialidase [Planctomycetaceae bacterium]|nr:exo-alpha-sialidase [Planctomycetaceae bacterium]
MPTIRHWTTILCTCLGVVFSNSRSQADDPAAPRRDYGIPVLDLSGLPQFHTIVAKDLDQENQYLGHPTTVLLDDHKSILAAFPTGHGGGDLRLMRSTDGGHTWARQSLSPEVRLHEVPTLFSTQLPNGKTRLVLVTCVPRTGEFQWMDSDDQGISWSPLRTQDLGLKNGIIVSLASMWRVHDPAGEPTHTWRGVFHDFRYENYTIDLSFQQNPAAHNGWETTWNGLRRIEFTTPAGLDRSRAAQLCEAGAIRSPDGSQLALLFRPQRKRTNAMISLSNDEGLTWSDPQELSGSLTGERHVARYAPDGRLLITFRDYSPLHPGNPTHADWVGWVGRWEDLVGQGEGQYRIRMQDNYGNSTNNNVGDCGYAGIELLPDETFVCTSYGHWELAPGEMHPNGRGRAPYIITTRFRLPELDAMVKSGQHLLRPE